MIRSLSLAVLLCSAGMLFAQQAVLTPIVHGTVSKANMDKASASGEAPTVAPEGSVAPALRAAGVDPLLAPFYHGVASGNPSADGILLWTRVTPDNPGEVSSVDWELSPDTAFSSILQSGTVTTDSSRDHTVKIPVSGLAEGTTYYYRFRTGGMNSLIGRTRTADQDASQLKFAVVSCNSYQGGYFNAFGRIAERNDIDAVVHLGDFIYEYESDTSDPDRGILEPENEILSAEDYRMRYGWYRLDPDLRRAMQQHPFIFVWDDHESANDSWTGARKTTIRSRKAIGKIEKTAPDASISNGCRSPTSPTSKSTAGSPTATWPNGICSIRGWKAGKNKSSTTPIRPCGIQRAPSWDRHSLPGSTKACATARHNGN